jgi:hypothetical protein
LSYQDNGTKDFGKVGLSLIAFSNLAFVFVVGLNNQENVDIGIDNIDVRTFAKLCTQLQLGAQNLASSGAGMVASGSGLTCHVIP